MQLLQLAWVKFRSGSSIHCRLGGTAETIGGGSYIVGNSENNKVIDEALGQSAPQLPPQGNLYAPGCTSGTNGNWK